MIDVGDGVIGVDLEPDLLVDPGNHRVGEAGCQDAALEERRHQMPGLFGVAEHQGHDGMLTRNDLVPQRPQVGLHPIGQIPQAVQETHPFGTVQDPQGGESRGSLGGGDRVGVDVRGRGLPEVMDHRTFGDHVSPVDRQRLAQSADQDISGRARIVFLGAPACGSEGAHPVGVIHDHHDVVGEAMIVPSGDAYDLVERCMVAAHGEDAVGHDYRPPCPAGRVGELAVERRHVQMGIHGLAQSWV